MSLQMYVHTCAHIHVCTYISFWPWLQTPRQFGTNYAAHNAIPTIAREALLEEMKFLLQTKNLLSFPQFSVWLKTQTKKKKKEEETNHKEDNFYNVILITHLLSLTQTFVLIMPSTKKASELSHWQLGLCYSSSYFKEQQLNYWPKRWPTK